MREILVNTFALDGIILWLGICTTLALMCIIGAAHQRARRLDWVLATAIMVIQLVACLICLIAEVFDLMDLFIDAPGLGLEQFIVDLISLAIIVPIEISVLLAGRRFALARFKYNQSVLIAGIIAGARVAEAVINFKEELASIRRLEFYEYVDTEDEE